MDRNLIDYLPDILQEVKEYKAIAATEQEEIGGLWDELNDRFNDQFVRDSTVVGVKRWEGMLEISPKGSNTLDERKFRILLRLNEQLPFTYRVLEQKLTALFGPDGFEIHLDHNAYHIEVIIHTFSFVEYEEIIDYLRRMLPANLGYSPRMSFKSTGMLYVGGFSLSGETITVFPYLPDELVSTGEINIAACHGPSVESITVYPKEVVF